MSKPLVDIMNLNLTRYGKNFDKEKFRVTFMEEVNETLDALANNDIDGFIDGLNDVIVVAGGGITQNGYNPHLTLKQTIKEITSRKQDPIQAYSWSINPHLQDTEKWLKDVNQCSETIYKADYKLCKL